MSAADRLRKLAALAGSDNVHEANEAARQACRIIRDGKVTIRDAAPEAPPPRARGWSPAYRDAWSPPPPPPPRRRPPARGPFARRPDVHGAVCVACGEAIPHGDAFSCADGYAHGDCVPAAERR